MYVEEKEKLHIILNGSMNKMDVPINKEIWKDIIGYEGYYQISNLGSVKSLEREVNRKYNKAVIKESILKARLTDKNYYFVTLSINRIKKKKTIHRLLAIHFIDNPMNKEQVNHIDKNKLNNNLCNLEWVSCRENICHSNSFKNRSSKYIGVTFRKKYNKWESAIRFNGKSVSLGNFSSEEEAYNERVKFERNNGIINKYI